VSANSVREKKEEELAKTFASRFPAKTENDSVLLFYS
jgi:hypothetical protein